MQDAVNLGWKLAQVIKGTSAESLLDTYHAERHPVGATVLHNTLAQVALSRPDERHDALRETMTELLTMDQPRKRIAGMISGLDVRYDLGEGHLLLGRRMPNIDLQTHEGPRQLVFLLHTGRPVLLNLGDRGLFERAAWTDRVQWGRRQVRRCLGASGDRGGCGSSALLIRPDGYVAWTGSLDDTELPRALAKWC